MNWFVSSDKTVALNLDNVATVAKSRNSRFYVRFNIVDAEFTLRDRELTQEHYNELIEFIEQRSVLYIHSDTVTSKREEPICASQLSLKDFRKEE